MWKTYLYIWHYITELVIFTSSAFVPLNLYDTSLNELLFLLFNNVCCINELFILLLLLSDVSDIEILFVSFGCLIFITSFCWMNWIWGAGNDTFLWSEIRANNTK